MDTVSQQEVVSQQDMNILSDLFKDVHGFRPRGLRKTMTVAEYDAAFAVLQKDLEINQKAEKIRSEKAKALWLKRMNTLASNLNTTLEQVIRWDIDAHEVHGDVGYYEHLNDLPYDFVRDMLKAK